jgi:hypothetical protein
MIGTMAGRPRIVAWCDRRRPPPSVRARSNRHASAAAGPDPIADLALSVAGDDVDDFGGAHSLAASPIEMRWSARVYQFRRGSKDSAKIAGYLADRVKADPLSLAPQLKSVATIVAHSSATMASPSRVSPRSSRSTYAPHAGSFVEGSRAQSRQ